MKSSRVYFSCLKLNEIDVWRTWITISLCVVNRSLLSDINVTEDASLDGLNVLELFNEQKSFDVPPGKPASLKKRRSLGTYHQHYCTHSYWTTLFLSLKCSLNLGSNQNWLDGLLTRQLPSILLEQRMRSALSKRGISRYKIVGEHYTVCQARELSFFYVNVEVAVAERMFCKCSLYDLVTFNWRSIWNRPTNCNVHVFLLSLQCNIIHCNLVKRLRNPYLMCMWLMFCRLWTGRFLIGLA